MKDVMILDCTLRDGGYYNNWDFSKEIVNDYLKTMSAVNINYVEVGFRSFQSKYFKGPTWYTTDSYLDSLGGPKKDISGSLITIMKKITGVIPNKKNNKINIKNKKINKKENIKSIKKGTKIGGMIKSDTNEGYNSDEDIDTSESDSSDEESDSESD